jgi:ketosteroid isomerase-like protein
MSHAYEDTLRTVYDAFGRGDMDTAMGLLTEDVEFDIDGRTPWSGKYSGKGGVLDFFGKLMELSGGTFRLEILDVLANDEHGVVLTLERGERDGKAVENRAVHVWDMRDGKCAKFRGYNEDVWNEFWA